MGFLGVNLNLSRVLRDRVFKTCVFAVLFLCGCKFQLPTVTLQKGSSSSALLDTTAQALSTEQVCSLASTPSQMLYASNLLCEQVWGTNQCELSAVTYADSTVVCFRQIAQSGVPNGTYIGFMSPDTTTPELYDFGILNVDETSNMQFPVTHNYGQALTGCYLQKYQVGTAPFNETVFRLASGQSTFNLPSTDEPFQLILTADPVSALPYQASVRVACPINGSVISSLPITLRVLGGNPANPPVIAFQGTPSGSFGSAVVGQATAPISFVMTNAGGTGICSSSIGSAPGSTSASVAAYSVVSAQSFTILPNSQQVVQVHVSPNALGSQVARLNVNCSGVTAYKDLSVTGIINPSLPFLQFESNQSGTLGTVAANGLTQQYQFTVTNLSAEATGCVAHVTSTMLGGPISLASGFSAVPSVASAPNNTSVVSVQVNPANMASGLYTANLTVSCANHGPITKSLMVGVGPGATFSFTQYRRYPDNNLDGSNTYDPVTITSSTLYIPMFDQDPAAAAHVRVWVQNTSTQEATACNFTIVANPAPVAGCTSAPSQFSFYDMGTSDDNPNNVSFAAAGADGAERYVRVQIDTSSSVCRTAILKLQCQNGSAQFELRSY